MSVMTLALSLVDDINKHTRKRIFLAAAAARQASSTANDSREIEIQSSSDPCV